jgi:hypothetical protein
MTIFVCLVCCAASAVIGFVFGYLQGGREE